jgi:hypothetical protein
MAMGLPGGTVRVVCPGGRGMTSLLTLHPVRARAAGAALVNPKTHEKRTVVIAEARIVLRQPEQDNNTLVESRGRTLAEQPIHTGPFYIDLKCLTPQHSVV